MEPAGHDVQAACSSLPVDPQGPANVLLLAPTMEGADDRACVDLLSDDPSGTDMLLVTVMQPPDQRLDAWRRHGGRTLPDRVGVIGVGDGMRSAAAASGGATTMSVGGSTVQTTTVSDPGDLTGLGIRISQALKSWEADDNGTVLCFHSLTALLQYGEVQSVFQFLHMLTKRVESVGGVAHYHMDPTAHDEQTLATIRSLFDTVLAFEDGAWQVR